MFTPPYNELFFISCEECETCECKDYENIANNNTNNPNIAKIEKVTKLFEEIFDIIFEADDWKHNEHYHETPKRLAKMFVNEIFQGVEDLKKSHFPDSLNIDADIIADEYKVYDSNNVNNLQQEVTVDGLVVKAFCAHHLAPFIGRATVTYVPNKKIIGLSKFQRILNRVCGIPTVQEELTNNFANILFKILEPKKLTVEMECIHTCMISRGVKTAEDTKTRTKATLEKKRWSLLE